MRTNFVRDAYIYVVYMLSLCVIYIRGGGLTDGQLLMEFHFVYVQYFTWDLSLCM